MHLSLDFFVQGSQKVPKKSDIGSVNKYGDLKGHAVKSLTLGGEYNSHEFGIFWFSIYCLTISIFLEERKKAYLGIFLMHAPLFHVMQSRNFGLL